MGKTIEEQKAEIEQELIDSPAKLVAMRKELIELMMIADELKTTEAPSLIAGLPQTCVDLRDEEFRLLGHAEAGSNIYQSGSNGGFTFQSGAIYTSGHGFAVPSTTRLAYELVDQDGVALTPVYFTDTPGDPTYFGDYFLISEGDSPDRALIDESNGTFAQPERSSTSQIIDTLTTQSLIVEASFLRLNISQ